MNNSGNVETKFWERFKHLCDLHGIAPNKICANLKFSKNIASLWEKGVLPNTRALIIISEYFECSIDYLLGRANKSITAEEFLLIGKLRKLPVDKQERVSGYVDALLDSPEIQEA